MPDIDMVFEDSSVSGAFFVDLRQDNVGSNCDHYSFPQEDASYAKWKSNVLYFRRLVATRPTHLASVASCTVSPG